VILGVLLAAGTGSRFDGGTESGFDGESEAEFDEENKLLADFDGEPIVTRAAQTLTESSLDATLAVVGHDAEAVERALPEEIEVVANPDYRQGQSTSVRRGIVAARERDAEAVLFALGDMPCVAVETVEAILDTYRENADDAPATASERPGIVAPRYDGQRGNPVLFDSRYFDALGNVEGDRGGRELLESEPVSWVEVEDSGVHRDVDTLADLRSLRNE
jgi:molybdenum cofactor cytidylyltransferase